MTINSHKSKYAEEYEEETDVDVTPFVTPKKAKKSGYPNMPALAKVTQKETFPTKTKPPTKSKSPVKKPPSKPLKVLAAIMPEVASEALENSKKDIVQEPSQKEARKKKKEDLALRKSSRLNA